MIIKLIEDFNPSMPSWLVKEVSGKNKYDRWYSNQYKGSKIDWNRAVYHPDTVPRSSRDPRLKDPRRLAIFRFADGTVIIPSVDDQREARLSDGNWKRYNRMSWKEVLDNVTDYGYLDLSDANTTRTQIQKDRASNKPVIRQPQYKDKYSNAWRTVRGYDKSGYKLDPYDLKSRLNKYKASKGVGNVLEKYYSRINDLSTDLKEKFSQISADDDYQNVRNLVKATDYFSDALSSYKDLKNSIEKRENQLANGADEKKVINQISEWDLGMYGSSIDRALKGAREYLAELSK